VYKSRRVVDSNIIYPDDDPLVQKGNHLYTISRRSYQPGHRHISCSTCCVNRPHLAPYRSISLDCIYSLSPFILRPCSTSFSHGFWQSTKALPMETPFIARLPLPCPSSHPRSVHLIAPSNTRFPRALFRSLNPCTSKPLSNSPTYSPPQQSHFLPALTTRLHALLLPVFAKNSSLVTIPLRLSTASSRADYGHHVK